LESANPFYLHGSSGQFTLSYLQKKKFFYLGGGYLEKYITK